MTTTSTNGAGEQSSTTEVKSEWAYHGTTEFEGDFESDIDSLIVDSGYCSFETPTHASKHNDSSSPYVTSHGAIVSDSFYADTVASLDMNQGSMCSSSVLGPCQNAEPVLRYQYPGDVESGPTPLEAWAAADERHERLLHRGVESSSRRRRTSKKRHSEKSKPKRGTKSS